MFPTAGNSVSLAQRIAKAMRHQGPTGKYGTTATSCDCPDHKFRGRECKHMRAFKVLFGEEEE